jgi:putative chitinase
MLAVTAAQLKAAAPTGNPQIIAAVATTSEAAFAKHGISNINRVWGCLSTFLEESGFKTLFENMNYTAARAHVVWPAEFPTVADAEPYAGNPQKLAEKVYGNRMGNVGPNAGWLYRGQGLMQITGENNFTLLAKLTGLDTVNHPEIVTTPEYMLECAVALFVSYPGILDYCDAGAFSHVWALVGTGRATGTVINLANHEAALAAIKKAIPALVDAPAAPAVAAAAPTPSPVDRIIKVQTTLDKISPTPIHESWLAKLEAHVAEFFNLD